MNNQYFQTLRNAGFEVEQQKDGVTVSLNRDFSMMEIEIALKHEVERHQIVRLQSNSYFIITLD